MKIGIFSSQYLPTVGGVERYTYEFAVRAIRAGHSVRVITSALEGLPQTETTPEGIVIYRLPVRPLMQGRFPFLKWNADSRRLMKRIWAEEFDACIVQARFYILSIYALRETCRRNIPAILIDHSSGHLQPDGWLSRKVGHWYEHLSARLVKRYCPHIYGVSQNVCRWLTHLGLKPEGVFYNSVDTQEIEGALKNKRGLDWRRMVGLDADDLIVLYSGRLIPEKGILELIQAIPLIGNPHVHLLIAGDGPLMQQIHNCASSQVHVLGSLDHDGMLLLFSQADVYCLPTIYAEGFPTTLLEAAACGCPIVTTNTSGVEELMPSGEYGTILADTNPKTIGAAISVALSNNSWLNQTGILLKNRIREQFDWDVTSGRVLERLEELTEREL